MGVAVIVSAVRDRQGFALAVVLLVVVLLATLAVTLSTLTIATRSQASVELDVDRSAYVARAGFERTCADLLMNADTWDTLSTAVYLDEPFAGGTYSVTIADRSTDGCTVEVDATHAGRTHELDFVVARETGGAPPGGPGNPTTGVRIVRVTDPTIDILSR